jgi:RNA polymerase sigma-70 factor (ECF subfamily)
MFHIARNARAEYSRRRRPEPMTETTPEPLATGRGPAQALESSEDLAHVRAALMEMTVEKRELIVLARYRELPHDQIAAILAIDVRNVRVRLHRAIKELRDRVDARSGGTRTCVVKTFRTGFPSI